MENNKELFELLDYQAKVLVGILCKRIEILEKESALKPSLYKALTKETIYEHFRTIKNLIAVGKVIFKTKKESMEE